MLSRSSIIVVVVLSSSVFACGGAIDPLTDGGTNPDGGPSPDGSPPPNPNCPSSAPDQGGSCAKEGIECEYGSDPRTVCNQIATCSSGAWDFAFGGGGDCPTPPQNPSECPATLTQAQKGGACSDEGTICNYSTSSATQFCACGSPGGPIMIDGGPNDTWQCAFTSNSGCPAVRPRLGTACAVSDQNCNYDECGLPSGLAFQCNSQTMTWAIGFGDLCAGAN